MRNYLNTLGSASPLATNFIPTFDVFAPIYGPNDPLGRTVSLTNDARQTQRSKTVDLDYFFRITPSLVWQTSLNYAYDNTSGIHDWVVSSTSARLSTQLLLVQSISRENRIRENPDGIAFNKCPKTNYLIALYPYYRTFR